MYRRKKIVFKVNDQIVLEDRRKLYPNQIDELKWFVAAECGCHYDDVKDEEVESIEELSELDVDEHGMFDWKSLDCTYITGMRLTIEEGSDVHLAAISSGTLENFISFF